MSAPVEKISVVEKIGYGMGDAAANFIFQTMLVFQLSFYTDTFGITAAAAGTKALTLAMCTRGSAVEDLEPCDAPQQKTQNKPTDSRLWAVSRFPAGTRCPGR